MRLMTFWLSLLWVSAAVAQPVKVVTTFSILKDLVQVVGGPDVDAHAIVGPDGDTHVYEPRPDDVKAMSHADLIIVNGLGFEGWLNRLVQTSGYKGEVVVASHGITPLTRRSGTDPHAWHNIQNVQQYVRNIEAALSQKDPAHKATYHTRAEAYLKELEALDAEVRAEVKALAPGARKIVTAHDAFGYFGKAYGVEFLSPQGVSTQAEPPAKEFAELVDLLKKLKIKTVFVENITNDRFIQQLAHETGAKVGGTLFSDALSGPKGPAPSYLAMMRHNVALLLKAMREVE